MRGQGVWADLLAQRLDKAYTRFGLNRERHELDVTRFRRPSVEPTDGQRDLFA